MLKLIIYKELREIILSTKFAATFGVCSLLIIMAFYTGLKNYQTGLLEYEASKAAQLQKFEAETDWSEVSSYQIFLPPKPLAYLVTGISNDLGRTANIDGRSSPVFSDSIYNEQTVFAVFRFLDLEFVFQVILSLFAILFAFDAINGEKERGTLRLSFSNAVPRASYILGKLTGSFLALALPLLIPALIGLLLLPIMRIVLTTDEWIRLTFFIVCGLLYLGVFLTLSVFLSCLTKYSSSSFLFLLIIWVCSVLIIPRASILLAGNMVKVPSSAENYFKIAQLRRQNARDMIKKINEYINKSNQKQREKEENKIEPLENNKELEKLVESLDEESNKKEQKLANRLNEERRNKQGKQEKLAFGISCISPTAVFTLTSTTLGGTSIELRHHFQNKAAAYSESFAEFIREKTGRNVMGQITVASTSTLDDKKAQQQPINPREIPEFVYQSPELSRILYKALPGIAILILFNMIFFCGAFLAFLRYDLR